MKNKILNYLIFFFLIGISPTVFSQIRVLEPIEEPTEGPIEEYISPTEPQNSQLDKLIGTWVLKEDPDSKWIFKNGKVSNYYNNILFRTYTFHINQTSPQCGYEVPTGEKFIYLKLINESNIEDIYCYEINTLNDQYLALIYIGGPNLQPQVYQKVD